MIEIYQGKKYSYSYEYCTGNYLLYDNERSKSAYLQGDDAACFYNEIEKIYNISDIPAFKTAELIENRISDYL
jgi:hypothetical protein